MKQYPNVKLHGKFSDLSFYSRIIFLPFIFLLMFWIANIQEFNLKGILFAVAITALFILSIYLFMHMAKAEIKDNKLHVQKYFRPKEVYELRELEKVKTYETGNAKHIQISEKGVRFRKDSYTFFTMNRNGVHKKYLVVGYNFYFGDEPENAESILKEILEDYKNN